jgi:hypothetical protein
MALVRALIVEVESRAAKLGDALASSSVILCVDRAGVPAIEEGGSLAEARHQWKQGVQREMVIDLLCPSPLRPASGDQTSYGLVPS